MKQLTKNELKKRLEVSYTSFLRYYDELSELFFICSKDTSEYLDLKNDVLDHMEKLDSRYLNILPCNESL